jgi:hypothetical protein
LLSRINRTVSSRFAIGANLQPFGFRRFNDEGGALGLNHRLEEPGDGFHGCGEVVILFVHRPHAGELQEPLHEMAAKLQAVFKLRQVAVTVGALAHELDPQQQRRQRRIQMMRRARRHFSHAGKLFQLEHGLAPANALANIGGRFEEMHWPVALPKRAETELHRKRRAAPIQPRGFDIQRRFARLNATHRSPSSAILASGTVGSIRP